jgi:hypothetical protein
MQQGTTHQVRTSTIPTHRAAALPWEMSSSSGANIDVGDVSFSNQALPSAEDRLHVLIDAKVLLVVLATVVPPDDEGALDRSPPLSFGI